MYYLEYLRARRVFRVYGSILLAIAICLIFAWYASNNASFDYSQTSNGHHAKSHFGGMKTVGTFQVQYDILFGLGTFAMLGLGTALASTFNRETAYAHFTFTLPVGRVRMALQLVAVDIATMLAGFALFVVLGLLVVLVTAGSQAVLTWTGDEPTTLVVGTGAALAWYGMLQLSTAWAPARAGQYTGLVASVLGFSLPLSQATFLGPLVHVFQAILFIDPLAYFTSVSINDRGDASIRSQLVLNAFFQAADVWLLAAAALAASILLWRRVEV